MAADFIKIKKLMNFLAAYHFLSSSNTYNELIVPIKIKQDFGEL
jgi:hypothetical protein